MHSQSKTSTLSNLEAWSVHGKWGKKNYAFQGSAIIKNQLNWISYTLTNVLKSFNQDANSGLFTFCAQHQKYYPQQLLLARGKKSSEITAEFRHIKCGVLKQRAPAQPSEPPNVDSHNSHHIDYSQPNGEDYHIQTYSQSHMFQLLRVHIFERILVSRCSKCYSWNIFQNLPAARPSIINKKRNPRSSWFS